MNEETALGSRATMLPSPPLAARAALRSLHECTKCAIVRLASIVRMKDAVSGRAVTPFHRILKSRGGTKARAREMGKARADRRADARHVVARRVSRARLLGEVREQLLLHRRVDVGEV